MRVVWFVVFILILWGCSTIQHRPLQLLGGSAPIYPQELKNSGIEGYVTLKYDVSTEGKVMNVRIVESDPPRVFDESARRTLSTWRFSPELAEGLEKKSIDVISRISFQLSSESLDY